LEKMANAKHDSNFVSTLIGVSSADGETPLNAEIDPITRELLVKASVSVTGSDGAIQDGSNPLIKATVKDLTNSNPLATQIVDSNGDAITSFGGGTQYTDGAASPASPIGTMPVFDNAGTITAVSDTTPLPVSATISTAGLATSTKQDTGNTSLASIDGKITAVNTGAVVVSSSALPTGAATATKQDTGNTSVASIDTKTPALGQALAAASVPVVLPSAQVTTLTPPAAITNYANETGGNLATIAGKDFATQTTLAALNAKVTAVNTGAVVVSSSALPTGAALESGGNLAAIAGAVKAEDAAHTSGDSGVMSLAVRNDALATTLTSANGDYSPIATNSTGAVFIATTSLVPGTGVTNLGKAEDAAHASGDTGVFTLGVRNDTLADITSASGDYSQQSTDIKGRVITATAPRTLKTAQQTTITSSTTETTVLTAVASTFLDVYGVIVANTSATACDVTFKDSTAGTTRFNIYVPAGETRGFMLPMDAAHNQSAVNNNWTATCSASVASIKITMLAVKMV
jgi:hypothetical protein